MMLMNNKINVFRLGCPECEDFSISVVETLGKDRKTVEGYVCLNYNKQWTLDEVTKRKGWNNE